MHQKNSDTLQSVLEEYHSNSSFTYSTKGASSAWRGFELQTLYICSKALECNSNEYVFRPESIEDLLIENKTSETPTVELIQVKAKDSPLKLSDIMSSEGKKDEFFGHIAFLLEKGISVTAKVVVFGKLGTELCSFSNPNTKSHKKIIEKIKGAYSASVASFCQTNLQFEEANENELKDKARTIASGFFEVSNVSDLFLSALTSTVRDASRHRGSLDFSSVQNIARKASLSVTAQSSLNNQYGKAFFPLSERFHPTTNPSSLEEYRLGINALPEHIATGYDVPRPIWLEEIDNALQETDTVVIQGASGQGKSTLCLRYLYERSPIYNAYIINGLMDYETADEIVAALSGISQSANGPLYIYIDNASGDAWVNIVQQLRWNVTKGVYFLISIREDEMNQLSLSKKDFPFSVIRPVLSTTEAKELYKQYENPAFPSFEESWRSFGSEGPLMEYTASLGTGTTLSSVIQSQVDGLIQENDDRWLYALLLASILGAEGLSVSPALLSRISGCNNMASFTNRVKNEHLLRIEADGDLWPLHPYRSKVIAKTLSDALPFEKEKLANDIVKCTSNGLGTLLVRLTNDNLDALPNIGVLIGTAGSDWVKLAEIIKYALWCDTRKLYFDSAGLRNDIRKMSKTASWLPFLISGGVANASHPSNPESFLTLLNDTQRPEAERILNNAKTHHVNYAETICGINAIDVSTLTAPSKRAEVKAAGFLLSQLSEYKTEKRELPILEETLFQGIHFGDLPLEDALDFVMGTQLCNCELPNAISENLKQRIVEHHSIAWLSVETSSIKFFQIQNGAMTNPNDALVDAIVDFRRLYPNAEEYCGEPLGLNAFIPADYASTFSKQIPVKNLPIYYLTLANKLFIAMCNYDDAMKTWDDLSRSIEQSASALVELSHEYAKAIGRWFEKGSPSAINKTMIEAAKKLVKSTYAATIAVPKESLDPQGFSVYASAADSNNRRNTDSRSVYDNHSNSMRFKHVSSLVNSLNSFAIHFEAALALVQGEDGQTQQKTIVRAQIMSLARIVETLELAKQEIEDAFHRPLIPNEFEEALVSLCCTLNTCITKKLRRERSVGYAQKLRANKIIKCRDSLSSRLIQEQGIAFARKTKTDLAFSIDLNALESDASFEAQAANALYATFGDLGKANRLAESVLIGHFLGDITIDYLFDGFYISSVCITGSQLVRHTESARPLFLQPASDSNVRKSFYPHNHVFDAYAIVQGLIPFSQYCLSINTALYDIDSNLNNATPFYEEWKRDIAKDAIGALSELEPLLQESLAPIDIKTDDIIIELKTVIEEIPRLACDASAVKYLDGLLQLIQKAMDYSFAVEVHPAIS